MDFQPVPSSVRDGTAKKEDAAGSTATRPSTRRNLLRSCFFLLGLASLCYLAGAAVIFFDLPSSSFLRRAFVGGVAWYEQNQSPPPPPEQRPPITVSQIDKPDKTYDGFTLCLCSGGTRAVIINMRGEVVHEWLAPLKKVWPNPPRLRVPVEESAVYFNDGHVYPNGDLLALVEGPVNARNQSDGYGLVKLDKDSHVLWKYTAGCHHAPHPVHR
jgi:hypothetical protein